MYKFTANIFPAEKISKFRVNLCKIVSKTRPVFDAFPP
jgi:hypothetical protein